VDRIGTATTREDAMLVKDRMSTPAVTLRGNADYKTALKLMQEHALHHVPVVDAAGQLAGIVAERDCLIAAMRYLQSTVEVSEIMHREVVTVTPDTSVTKAALLMLNHKIGGLPVMGDHGRVIGVITESDIFRAFVETLPEEKVINVEASRSRAKPLRVAAGARTKPKAFRRGKRAL
jgi:CBS domain-containing protein